MHVAFLAWRDLAHPNAGGSEIVVDRLITGLQARGHTATLVCGGPVGDRPYPVVDAGGTFDQYLRAPRLVRRHAADADLLVEVINGMPYLSPWWWRGPTLGLVHHVHGRQWHHYFPTPVAVAGSFAERVLLPRAFRHRDVIAISASTTTSLETLGLERQHLHLMHSGLDDALLAATAGPAPARRAEPLFLAFGRLVPNKGFDRLLDLWDQVRPVVGGRLVIAGDGPERPRLAARATPGSGIELVGRVSEAEKLALLQQAWLLVHTAHREGWGLVIMEAAAAGTPAIALDVAGVRDAIVDDVTGVLAPTPAAFASAWVALAGDPDRRARLGEEARRRAHRFTWDRAVDAFLDAADAALDRHRAPTSPAEAALDRHRAPTSPADAALDRHRAPASPVGAAAPVPAGGPT